METPLSEKAPLTDSSSSSYLFSSFACTHAERHTHTRARENKDQYTNQACTHKIYLSSTKSGAQKSKLRAERAELTFNINRLKMSHLQEAKQELRRRQEAENT